MAAAFAIHREGLPPTYLWHFLFRREGVAPAKPSCCGRTPRALPDPIFVMFRSMVGARKMRCTPTMCHPGCTHQVQVSWWREPLRSPNLEPLCEKSVKQAADIYTKYFDNAAGLAGASLNISVIAEEQLDI